MEGGRLAEHWDVLQDEATAAESLAAETPETAADTQEVVEHPPAENHAPETEAQASEDAQAPGTEENG